MNLPKIANGPRSRSDGRVERMFSSMENDLVVLVGVGVGVGDGGIFSV